MKYLILPLVVAGCGMLPVKEVKAPAMGQKDTCGAIGFQPAIGTHIKDVTVPADRVVRVIGPDTAVTLDFDPTRMNFEVDGMGKVLSVRCG